MTNIEAAHVRLGSNTGMGQKPDDWRTVPLCAGPYSDIKGQLGCHNRQHVLGEASFWRAAKMDPEALIKELIAASPKRADIVLVQKERANGA